jgi:hypothetical protein
VSEQESCVPVRGSVCLAHAKLTGEGRGGGTCGLTTTLAMGGCADYNSEECLRARLTTAIGNAEGFGLM